MLSYFDIMSVEYRKIVGEMKLALMMKNDGPELAIERLKVVQLAR